MVEKTEVWGGKVIYPRSQSWKMGSRDSYPGVLPSGPQLVGTGLG